MRKRLLLASAAMLLLTGASLPDAEVLREKIAWPCEQNGEVTMTRVTVAPNSRSGVHTHPYRVMSYVLEGEIDVIDANGTRHYKAGDAYLETELPHEGFNNTSKPTVLLFSYLAVPGAPLSTPSSQK